MLLQQTENVLFVIVFVLALLPLIGVLLIGASVRVRVVLLALAGVAIMAAIPRPVEDISLARALPVPTSEKGMRSSNSCRSCHPGQYDTWHRSFHRTMTQAASPKSVVGRFEGQRLEWNDQAFVLARHGDEFWITEVETADNSRVPVAQPQRVMMTTGSRHQQIYWTSGDDGGLKQLPWVYEIAMARWIPSEHTFMRPDDWKQHQPTWNHDCIRCHSVGPHPNFNVQSEKWETKVTELGIACAGCHGPAAEHIRAHRNPLHRHSVRASGEPDPTIINPAHLNKERSAEVCGQCHSFMSFYDDEAHHDDFHSDRWRQYRPGGKLQEYFKLHKDARHKNSYWPDGSARIGGREFNAMILSGCYTHGQMNCLSCHTMHGDDPYDQMKPVMKSDQGCLQCHETYRNDIAAHTRHPVGSEGSRCYNCHMPHTGYALLGAVRMHRVDSPTTSRRSTRDRPNACNLCHLDKTLAWTAEHLTDWYDAPPSQMTGDHRKVAAGALWALKGDAAQRAVVAWHMGQPWVIEAAGDKWMTPYLARLLLDPYSANRLMAHRSLVAVTGEDIPFDYIGPKEDRRKVSMEYMAKWVEARRADDETGWPATLIEAAGKIHLDFERIYRQRDNRKLILSE